MKKFIYSVKEIFSIDEGCLFAYDVKGYYIAPYQRGYKWKSESAYDQVPVLLMDLYEAFKSISANGNSDQEYYLQYITVKKNGHSTFEVIDGQQRLTTLTLLFNILEYSKLISTNENIAKHEGKYLVNYTRYEKAETNIFDQVLNQIEVTEENDKFIQEQDKFFMVKATRCIQNFFRLIEKENSDKFIEFINRNVKIILNKEDDTTGSEEIFANLNSNKVPLTNAYLIKGLLLTKASRYSAQNKSIRFKEVMDQRSIMGRTWDEITSWFSKPDVSLLFFGSETNGIEKFLELVSLKENNNSSEVLTKFKEGLKNDRGEFENPYVLFNKFHENIITTKDSLDVLDQIKHTYWRLKSWYNDNEIFNLIAYRQAKRKKDLSNSFDKLIEMLDKTNRSDLIKSLQEYVISRLPKTDESFDDIGYKKYNRTMDILLAINIFQINIDKKEHIRFDFYTYQKEEWSLEHIFPQNPDKDDFDVKDDKQWVIQKIHDRINILKEFGEIKSAEIIDLEGLISDITNNKEISTRSINFIFEDINDVDDLGNMALLSKGVNSALSNGFFNTKRKILINKINKGSFVPKHTIDVFSKMLELDSNKDNIKFDDSLISWSKADIVANRVWIEENTIKIIKNFTHKNADKKQMEDSSL